MLVNLNLKKNVKFSLILSFVFNNSIFNNWAIESINDSKVENNKKKIVKSKKGCGCSNGKNKKQDKQNKQDKGYSNNKNKNEKAKKGCSNSGGGDKDEENGDDFDKEKIKKKITELLKQLKKIDEKNQLLPDKQIDFNKEQLESEIKSIDSNDKLNEVENKLRSLNIELDNSINQLRYEYSEKFNYFTERIKLLKLEEDIKIDLKQEDIKELEFSTARTVSEKLEIIEQNYFDKVSKLVENLKTEYSDLKKKIEISPKKEEAEKLLKVEIEDFEELNDPEVINFIRENLNVVKVYLEEGLDGINKKIIERYDELEEINYNLNLKQEEFENEDLKTKVYNCDSIEIASKLNEDLDRINKNINKEIKKINNDSKSKLEYLINKIRIFNKNMYNKNNSGDFYLESNFFMESVTRDMSKEDFLIFLSNLHALRRILSDRLTNLHERYEVEIIKLNKKIKDLGLSVKSPCEDLDKLDIESLSDDVIKNIQVYISELNKCLRDKKIDAFNLELCEKLKGILYINKRIEDLKRKLGIEEEIVEIDIKEDDIKNASGFSLLKITNKLKDLEKVVNAKFQKLKIEYEKKIPKIMISRIENLKKMYSISDEEIENIKKKQQARIEEQKIKEKKKNNFNNIVKTLNDSKKVVENEDVNNRMKELDLNSLKQYEDYIDKLIDQYKGIDKYDCYFNNFISFLDIIVKSQNSIYGTYYKTKKNKDVREKAKEVMNKYTHFLKIYCKKVNILDKNNIEGEPKYDNKIHLGDGGYGSIYRIDDGILKVLYKNGVKEKNINKTTQENFEKEIFMYKIFKGLNNLNSDDFDFFTTLKDYYIGKDNYYIIMNDYKTDLFTYLNGGELVKNKLGIYNDIIKCILDMHKIGIAHCDLKPENIFFYLNYVYIGDFGSCQIYEENGEYPFVNDFYLPEKYLKANKKHNDMFEMDLFRNDIYALGLLILEIETKCILHDPNLTDLYNVYIKDMNEENLNNFLIKRDELIKKGLSLIKYNSIRDFIKFLIDENSKIDMYDVVYYYLQNVLKLIKK